MHTATVKLVEAYNGIRSTPIYGTKNFGFEVSAHTVGYTLRIGCQTFAITSKLDLMNIIEDLVVNHEEVYDSIYGSGEAAPEQPMEMPNAMGGTVGQGQALR